VAENTGIKQPSTGKKEQSTRARQRWIQKKQPVVVPTEPLTEYQREFLAVMEMIKAMNPEEQLDAIKQLQDAMGGHEPESENK
jgi:ribosomal protein S9